MTIPSVNTWVFGEAREVSEGLRSFPISVGGKWLTIQLLDAVSPFELSSLNEASTRKTLTLRLPREWDQPFGDMEAALVKAVVIKSEALFGVSFTEEQLQGRYKSISKKSGEYPRCVRAKVNQGPGAYATRFWDMDKAATPAPEAFTGRSFNAVLTVRSLWVSSDAWGLVCDATDLQAADGPPAQCPFGGA